MRESSQADALRAEQGTRLRELGVAASAIPGAFASDPPPPADASVRVLQWNVLAHGLSDDGFIVNTVLVRRRHRHRATARPSSHPHPARQSCARARPHRKATAPRPRTPPPPSSPRRSLVRAPRATTWARSSAHAQRRQRVGTTPSPSTGPRAGRASARPSPPYAPISSCSRRACRPCHRRCSPHRRACLPCLCRPDRPSRRRPAHESPWSHHGRPRVTGARPLRRCAR